MADKPDLTVVVPLDPDCKPQVGNLTTAIKDIIDEYCTKNNVTLAEAIGVLEIIKFDTIQEARDAELY